MSAVGGDNGMNSYSEGQGEVCPHCSVVCNVGCDFWCLVRLKGRSLEDDNQQHPPHEKQNPPLLKETGKMWLEITESTLKFIITRDKFILQTGQRVFKQQRPCLLSVVCQAFLTDREQSIVLEMLDMANSADEHSNTLGDAGDKHATTPQIRKIEENESSILNSSTPSKLRSGQGELKQVTPIKVDEEQENERNLALSPTRVQFSPTLVSEVHFQEKVDISERRQLFYSVYEESRWRMDKMREDNRAKVQCASTSHSRPKLFSSHSPLTY